LGVLYWPGVSQDLGIKGGQVAFISGLAQIPASVLILCAKMQHELPKNARVRLRMAKVLFRRTDGSVTHLRTGKKGDWQPRARKGIWAIWTEKGGRGYGKGDSWDINRLGGRRGKKGKHGEKAGVQASPAGCGMPGSGFPAWVPAGAYKGFKSDEEAMRTVRRRDRVTRGFHALQQTRSARKNGRGE